MSKMDGLRAMREARYAETMARAKTEQPAKAAQAKGPAQAPTKAKVKPTPAKVEVAEEQQCGHRAISGRTCTREQGHAAKSHRYA